MNAFECVRRVYQMDGLRGFYRGMSASYAGISETVIHFVIYESIKRKLLEAKAHASMDEEDESVKDASDFVGMMLAAATSKTCATSIAYPHGTLLSHSPKLFSFLSMDKEKGTPHFSYCQQISRKNVEYLLPYLLKDAVCMLSYQPESIFLNT